MKKIILTLFFFCFSIAIFPSTVLSLTEEQAKEEIDKLLSDPINDPKKLLTEEGKELPEIAEIAMANPSYFFEKKADLGKKINFLIKDEVQMPVPSFFKRMLSEKTFLYSNSEDKRNMKILLESGLLDIYEEISTFKSFLYGAFCDQGRNMENSYQDYSERVKFFLEHSPIPSSFATALYMVMTSQIANVKPSSSDAVYTSLFDLYLSYYFHHWKNFPTNKIFFPNFCFVSTLNSYSLFQAIAWCTKTGLIEFKRGLVKNFSPSKSYDGDGYCLLGVTNCFLQCANCHGSSPEIFETCGEVLLEIARKDINFFMRKEKSKGESEEIFYNRIVKRLEESIQFFSDDKNDAKCDCDNESIKPGCPYFIEATVLKYAGSFLECISSFKMENEEHYLRVERAKKLVEKLQSISAIIENISFAAEKFDTSEFKKKQEEIKNKVKLPSGFIHLAKADFSCKKIEEAINTLYKNSGTIISFKENYPEYAYEEHDLEEVIASLKKEFEKSVWWHSKIVLEAVFSKCTNDQCKKIWKIVEICLKEVVKHLKDNFLSELYENLLNHAISNDNAKGIELLLSNATPTIKQYWKESPSFLTKAFREKKHRAFKLLAKNDFLFRLKRDFNHHASIEVICIGLIKSLKDDDLHLHRVDQFLCEALDISRDDEEKFKEFYVKWADQFYAWGIDIFSEEESLKELKSCIESRFDVLYHSIIACNNANVKAIFHKMSKKEFEQKNEKTNFFIGCFEKNNFEAFELLCAFREKEGIKLSSEEIKKISESTTFNVEKEKKLEKFLAHENFKSLFSDEQGYKDFLEKKEVTVLKNYISQLKQENNKCIEQLKEDFEEKFQQQYTSYNAEKIIFQQQLKLKEKELEAKENEFTSIKTEIRNIKIMLQEANDEFKNTHNSLPTPPDSLAKNGEKEKHPLPALANSDAERAILLARLKKSKTTCIAASVATGGLAAVLLLAEAFQTFPSLKKELKEGKMSREKISRVWTALSKPSQKKTVGLMSGITFALMLSASKWLDTNLSSI